MERAAERDGLDGGQVQKITDRRPGTCSRWRRRGDEPRNPLDDRPEETRHHIDDSAKQWYDWHTAGRPQRLLISQERLLQNDFGRYMLQ